MRLALAYLTAASAAGAASWPPPSRARAAGAVMRPAARCRALRLSCAGPPHTNSSCGGYGRGRSFRPPRAAGQQPDEERLAPSRRLVDAAFRGDVDEARALLDSGLADVNAKAQGAGGPAAADADARRWKIAVKRALAPRMAGPVVETFHDVVAIGNPRSWARPLVVAAGVGQTAVMELLLQRGADLSLQGTSEGNPQGQQALLAAAMTGQTAAVRLLLDSGVSPNTRRYGEDEIMDVFEYGHPVLLLASAAGRLEVCQLLIERGARVNARSHGINTAGKTALMVAAAEGHTDIVHLLLAHGADPNLRYRQDWRRYSLGYGMGALHTAALRSNVDCARLLCDYGADVNLRTSEGETPLMFAARAESLPVVELLVDRGADVNMLTRQESGPVPVPVVDLENDLEFDINSINLLPLMGRPSMAAICFTGQHSEVARFLESRGAKSRRYWMLANMIKEWEYYHPETNSQESEGLLGEKRKLQALLEAEERRTAGSSAQQGSTADQGGEGKQGSGAA